MVGTLLALQLWRRQPIGIALLGGAIAGALVAGQGLPIRHLVEGAFTYLDPIIIIFTAMLFMRILEENGALGQLAGIIIRLFGRRPLTLVAAMTLFVMFPAMLTGITTTSVLTTGALMAAPLVSLGVERSRVATLIAVVSVMGMLAPPINLLAMLIGQGVDMPYIGFELPLLAVTIPVALITSLVLAYPTLRRSDPDAANSSLAAPMTGSKLYLFVPLIFVFGLMTSVRIFPEHIPDIGIPLIFVIGSILGLMTGKSVSFVRASYRALKIALPVLGLLAGVGAFLQIMTLTGVRGLLVLTVLGLPMALKYVGLAISLPLFGGVSAFASAMVFGVAFLLGLLGGNEVAVCAAISILAGLGDLLPPSAINARFAAQVTGGVNLKQVIIKALPFIALAGAAALAVIAFTGAN